MVPGGAMHCVLPMAVQVGDPAATVGQAMRTHVTPSSVEARCVLTQRSGQRVVPTGARHCPGRPAWPEMRDGTHLGGQRLRVGAVMGCPEGRDVGCRDGWPVGVVGWLVGCIVGVAVGCPEGFLEG